MTSAATSWNIWTVTETAGKKVWLTGLASPNGGKKSAKCRKPIGVLGT